MRCQGCGLDNPEGAKFCIECGVSLQHRCPNCGFENLTRAKFCGECGTPLTGTPVAPTSIPTGQQLTLRDAKAQQLTTPSAADPMPEAERRQLTVLFCDLVDSTRLAGRLDPEDLREVVGAYQTAAAEVIQRFDGHIAQYLGDGLLVYVGYPQAHEDDASRAVRTGLGIVEAMGRLNTRLEREQNVRLAVRVGVHTGLVVVGEMGGGGRREQLALGETPNLAARLQGLAEPDSVLISAATHRLIQGLFECRDLGPHALKGISEPVSVYHVWREGMAQSRLELAGPTGLTPLVGRDQEVGLLLDRWAQVKDGLGQVVLLSGEAGIGKSRLVQVVKAHVAGEPHFRWECRCSPYYQNSALYPVIDLFQRVLQFQADDSPPEKLGKLEQALAPYDLPWSDVVPLFASLLSLPLGDRYTPLNLTPERQKQKTLEAVLGLWLALAAQRPVLLIVEDLHWVDPSTLDLLNLVIDQGPMARILTVLACRPEFRPPWGFRAHLTQLTLSRLPRTQAEVMVERVTGGKALPAEVRQQVVAKTDGVPLFVEELTKMVLESGLLQEREDRYQLMGPLPSLAIPATLHDSLMARLDRLATVREVAQLGATLGRAFAYELLQAVSPQDEATLQHALAQLVEAELLYQRGVPPQATYLFKHALIQDAAYQALLKSTRQRYHLRIAQVLEERFPETCETQPELLAHHYTEAGLGGQALPYWQRAGERAIRRSANLEAIAHLTKGLEMLKTLPGTTQQTQQELVLQTTLGPVLQAIKGQAAPEVERTYARARELCQQVEETPQLFPVLWGLWYFYLVRAELQTAREVGEQLLSLAQRLQEPILLLLAHRALGQNLSFLGELPLAQTHLEQAIALYDRQQHRSLAFQYGQDPAVVSRSWAASTLWLLGYPEQALQKSREALELARELAHSYTLAYALNWAAMLHLYRREGQAAQERAGALTTLSREHEISMFAASGTFWRGLAPAEEKEGLAQMRQSLAAWRATGAGVFQPYYLALLAEAYGEAGQVEQGLTALAEALATIDTTGERYYEAELYRLKGELLLQQAVGATGRSPLLIEAETCFHQALDVARRQQAKSLELRAAISLSRLWQQQGKRDEARGLLAEVYGWFTEGFDTADLQEAKALLEELS